MGSSVRRACGARDRGRGRPAGRDPRTVRGASAPRTASRSCARRIAGVGPGGRRRTARPTPDRWVGVPAERRWAMEVLGLGVGMAPGARMCNADSAGCSDSRTPTTAGRSTVRPSASPSSPRPARCCSTRPRHRRSPVHADRADHPERDVPGKVAHVGDLARCREQVHRLAGLARFHRHLARHRGMDPSRPV